MNKSGESENQHPSRSPLSEAEGSVTRRSLFARMFTLATALPIAGIFAPRAIAAKIDSPAGHGFYKIVSYQVTAEHWQEFLNACKINGAASIKEPGITRFEVLLSNDTPNTAIAVEVYKDEDASKAHQQTAHFHAFVQTGQRLGVKRTVVAATRYYPA
ncbi:putative quinol monooxygenase [Acidicapsa acidisoli]|uniref:putative quinol monooxygenase n=1 Tax=Acidicapsa acidisoli TaxID=1615681 RepID=UPI0021DF735A|nr:antibiotic biosynthesis monooxygenase family protein [Acidicapsa acidisoli]